MVFIATTHEYEAELDKKNSGTPYCYLKLCSKHQHYKYS